MSRKQQALTAFWVLILLLLAWQFYGYNQSLNQPNPALPDPHKRYVFLPHSGTAAAGEPGAPVDGASVKQVAFNVQNGVPTPAMITCSVTAKNFGKAKATGVQVEVRPYKDGSTGDEDGGGLGSLQPIGPNDPRAQISQWVTFPDLAPGESVSENTTFVAQQGANPGHNSNPQVLFQTEKQKP